MAEKIKINFLGTSSTVPTATRNHMANLLNYKDEHILIDCGEGTQRQFRLAKINPCQITRILLTHLHGDHTFGLPGLFHTLALNNYNKILYIYGPRGTKLYIENIFRIFAKNKEIKYEVKEVSGKFFENKDFRLIAFSLEHDAPCNGYLFEEKDKLRIDRNKLKKLKLPNSPELSKLINGKDIKINNKLIKSKSITYLQKGRKISFVFDTRVFKNIEKFVKNSDLAVIEATFLSDSENGDSLAKEYFHLTGKQAAQIAKKSHVKKLVLTHLSQRYENKMNLILDEAKKVFKNSVLAHDFLSVDI